MSENKVATEEVDDTNTEDIPSVFINTQLLPTTEFSRKRKHDGLRKFYEIGDTIFIDDSDDDNKIFCRSLVHFELKEVQNEEPLSGSTPEQLDATEYDEREELKIILEETSNGYLINRSVYLSFDQWHTITQTDLLIDVSHCIMCDSFFEPGFRLDHVRSPLHDENLKTYKPLERFELSITRKINNIFHCGVCNMKFDESIVCIHYNDRIHGWNLMTAMNKAVDCDNRRKIENNGNIIDNNGSITYNYIDNNAYKNEDLHLTENNNYDDNLCLLNPCNSKFYSAALNKKKLNEIGSEVGQAKATNPEGLDIHSDVPDSFDLTNVRTYSEAAKKPNIEVPSPVAVKFADNTVKVKFQSWHSIINSGPKEVYCMVCEKNITATLMYNHCIDEEHVGKLSKCVVIESHEDFVIRKFDDKFNHCSRCNNLHCVYDTQNHIDVAHRAKCINKDDDEPKSTGTSENNTTDIKHVVEKRQNEKKNKELTTTNALENNTADIRTVIDIGINENNENESKMKDASVQNIKEIETIVEEVINQNDEKKKKNKKKKGVNQHNNKTNQSNKVNINQTNNAKYTIDNVKINQSNNVINAINNATGITNNVLNTINNIPINHGEVELFIFGCKLTISALSYNVICKRDNDYYCGLCDVAFMEDYIVNHINWVKHLVLMQNSPFLLQFSVNLIRYVRHMLHCALCNLPILPQIMHIHNATASHLDLLARAFTAHISNTNESSRTGTALNTQELTNQPNQDDINKSQTKQVNQKISKEIHIENNQECNDIKKSDMERLNLNKEHKIANASANSQEADLKLRCQVVPNVSIDTNDTSLDKMKGVYVFEDIVRIVLSNTRFEISLQSYNTIVHIGDGTSLCAVCDVRIFKGNFEDHVATESHVKHIAIYLFLEDYNDHLIRQLPMTYHCATCNVLIRQTQLESHLQWPKHTTTLAHQCRLKKYRHRHKKACVATQKEIKFVTKENPIKILLRAEITENGVDLNLKLECENANMKEEHPINLKTAEDNMGNLELECNYPKPAQILSTEKSKVLKLECHNVNIDGKNLKVDFYNWNGLRVKRGVYKCILCQIKFAENVIEHINSETHRLTILNEVDKRFLIRKVNVRLAHCIICNVQLMCKSHIIIEHISNNCHKKKYKELMKHSKSNENPTEEVQPDFSIRNQKMFIDDVTNEY